MSQFSLRKKFYVFLLLILAASVNAQKSPEKENPALLRKLETPDHRIQAVAYTPDGKLLAAGYGFYDDGGITVWKTTDYKVAARIYGRTVKGGVESLEFSPDGKLIAAATDKGDVFLWQVGAWQTARQILRKRGDTTDLTFSPDGSKIALTTEKTAVLFDLATGREKSFNIKDKAFGSYNGVGFSADGKYLLLFESQNVEVFDAENGSPVKSLNNVESLFFGRVSRDGKRIIAGGGAVYGEKSVGIYDFSDGRKLNELTGFRNGIFALSIAPSGKIFAVSGGTYGGSDGGTVSLWETETGRELGYASFGESPIQGLAFSPDEKILAAGSYEGYVLLYDAERLRGAEVKEQTAALCVETLVENNKTYVVPLAKVPVPQRDGFRYAWKMEVSNPQALGEYTGVPIVLQKWFIESSAGEDRTRVSDFKPLASGKNATADSIVFGFIQNPGWNEGYIAKIYADGSFVTANNPGVCKSYGNLSQLNTDFSSVRKRLTDARVLEIPKTPNSPLGAHYGMLFIELTEDSKSELRTDADSLENVLNAKPANKREAFRAIYSKEEAFINQLLSAGLKLPLQKQ